MSLITDKDVEIVIHRAVNSEAKVLNYKLEPFAPTKNGILGSHTLLTVDVKNPSRNSEVLDMSTFTFFVKTPPDSEVIQDLLMDEGMFEEEVNFHNDIQPLMLSDYKGEKWSAKCYLAKPDALVYEDLRAQGFSSPLEMIMDRIWLESALGSLARFHASSLLAEAKLGKTLNEAFPKYFTEKLFCDHNKQGRILKISFEVMVSMAEIFGLDSSLILPDLFKYVHNKVKPKDEEVNVVCHSDLWKNNMMFNDKKDCILVDYQILRYASPAIDVAMLIYVNTPPEFRKTLEIKAFDHYYSVFQETLRQSNPNLRTPSYDYMKKEYLNHRIVGMTYAAFYLPGFYLKPAVFAKLMNDPKALENYLFHNRMEYIGSEIESNTTYSKQMKDILVELINECRRVLNP